MVQTFLDSAKLAQETAKPKKKRGFTAPDGTFYPWLGKGNPSQADIDAIVDYHEREGGKRSAANTAVKAQNAFQGAGSFTPGTLNRKTNRATGIGPAGPEATAGLKRAMAESERQYQLATTRPTSEQVITGPAAIRGAEEATKVLTKLVEPVAKPIGNAFAAIDPAWQLAERLGVVAPGTAGSMLAGGIGGVMSAPVQVAAELAQIADPNVSLRDKGGALLNIGGQVVPFEAAVVGGTTKAIKAGIKGAKSLTKAGKAATAIEEIISTGIKAEKPIAKTVKNVEVPKAPEITQTPKKVVNDGIPKTETEIPKVEAPKQEAPPTVKTGETTGVSMYARTKDAERLGTPMPERIKGLTNEEAFNQAKARQGTVDAPGNLRTLAEAKKPASQSDIADFEVHRGSLIAQVDDLGKRLDANPTDDVLRTRYNAVHEKIAEFDKDLDIVKSENGRALNALKIGNRVEDMTFEEVKAEARRRFNVEINPKQEEQFKKIQADYDQAQIDLETANKRIAELEWNAKNRGARQPKTKEAIKAERSALVEQLKAMRPGDGGVKQTANRGAAAKIGAEDLKFAKERATLAVKIVKTYWDEGILTIDELVKKIRADGLTEEDLPDQMIYEAASGKLTERGPRSQKSTVKSDVRAEARVKAEIGKIEDEFATGRLTKPEMRKKRQYLKDQEAQRLRLESLRKQKAVRLKALEPQTVVSKVNRIARDIQLTNVEARLMDIASNSVKMTAHVAQNPLRSLISQVLFGKTTGRETLRAPFMSWRKTQRLFENAPARWRQETSDVLKGLDMDTLEKYGPNQGFVTKATGITDVPFRDTYYRMALDDYSVSAAKRDPKARQAIWEQLTKGTDGPLTDAQVMEAKAIAHDWSLRQTYNVDNIASWVAGGIKENPARFIEKSVPGPMGKESADAWRFLADSVTRFSRVIGNVALEKANYAYGLPEAGFRLARAKVGAGMAAEVPKNAKLLKRAAIKTKATLFDQIPAQDARLITDLAARGLTGIAIYKLGQSSYDYLKDQEWIKGEVVSTEGGTKFVQWTLFPKLYGGIDADQLGGAFSALLRGATETMIRKSDLTDKQKASILQKYELDQMVNQPLTSGIGDAIKTTTGDKDWGQWAGSQIARQTIPGQVSRIAERQDEIQTGTKLRKSKSFWDEFLKRTPKTPLNPNSNRQTLPSNQKKPSQ